MALKKGLAALGLEFIPVGAHKSDRVISAAQTLTPPAGADRIALAASGQDVRFTLDGTAPTATNGFPLVAGAAAVVIVLPVGATLKVIQAAATATLQEQWGKLG